MASKHTGAAVGGFGGAGSSLPSKRFDMFPRCQFCAPLEPPPGFDCSMVPDDEPALAAAIYMPTLLLPGLTYTRLTTTEVERGMTCESSLYSAQMSPGLR